MTKQRRSIFGIVTAAICLSASCIESASADYGPQTEVREARAAEHAAWRAYCPNSKCPTMPVPDVTVVGRYALVTWADRDSGGQSLLRRDKSRWHRIGHGGGVMGIGSVEGYGAPHNIAVKLVAHNRESWIAEHYLETHAHQKGAKPRASGRQCRAEYSLGACAWASSTESPEFGALCLSSASDRARATRR